MSGLILAALAVGAVAGLLSGLLGIGGGIVIVPLMALALHQGQHIAQGVSLAVIVPTALIGTWTNWRKGNIDQRIAFLFAIGAVSGSVLGASIAGRLGDRLLQQLFAVILVGLGYFVLPVSLRHAVGQGLRSRGRPSSAHRPVPPNASDG